MLQNDFNTPSSALPPQIPGTNPSAPNIPERQFPNPACTCPPGCSGNTKRPRGSFFSGCMFGCSGCLLPFMFLMLLAVLCGSSMEENVTRNVLSGPQDTFMDDTCDKVAIININETIMSDDGFILNQIEDVTQDSTVKAIVLRMDTPGGSVSASDFYYNKLTKLRQDTNIPIVVSMGGICASGGYYIAMSCGNETEDVIFAEPTTWTGSIGVIISNYDFSGLAEKVGVKEDSIKSHELKGMGSLARPLTEQERTILQDLVDQAFARFREVVYSGRKNFNENHDALTPIATGQVFTTRDALESGLVDREGYLEDAIARAIELAGLDASTTQVYSYSPQETLSDLMSATHEKLEETPMDTVRSFVTPRACYLWSVGN